jgi:hypothetical protein
MERYIFLRCFHKLQTSKISEKNVMLNNLLDFPSKF